MRKAIVPLAFTAAVAANIVSARILNAQSLARFDFIKKRAPLCQLYVLLNRYQRFSKAQIPLHGYDRQCHSPALQRF